MVADPAAARFQFDPVGTAKFTASCDIAKRALAKRSASPTQPAAPAGPRRRSDRHRRAASTAQACAKPSVATAEVQAASIEGRADRRRLSRQGRLRRINRPLVVGLLIILVVYVTMVYGPIAAMLVEMFPTRIRYTSMSLPYHIGNGWFGGFLPATAFAIVAAPAISIRPLVPDRHRRR